MGWISKRHMERGGSIGPGGLGEAKKGAPLKRIVRTVSPGGSMFSPDVVLFECGTPGARLGRRSRALRRV